MNHSPTSRRHFLRGAGVALALPALDSLRLPNLHAATSGVVPDFRPDGKPRRMIMICNNLSLHAPFYEPTTTGSDYAPSRYLKEIDEYRDDYTVFSGVSHPSVDGGHIAEKSFLTGAPHPGSGSFKNSISLDQYAADFIGNETRYESLTLSGRGGSNSLSWTRAGVPIPGENKASKVFRKLFLAGSEDEVESRIRSLREGESIMDTVLGQAKSVEKKLNAADRDKFDEYLTSIREVESQMLRQQEWEKTPKPQVDAEVPKDIDDNADVIGRAQLLFDLSHLAFQTDSTRIITVLMQGDFLTPPIEGVTEGYHTVSHHGQNEQKVEQLAKIEAEHLRQLGKLLGKLRNSDEEDETLLDRTMVMYGSNMGNASSHDNRNLPLILAGGGFKHGQHLGFSKTDNYPVANLFVSMLQRLGIETDQFATATGTMTGLEMT